MSGRRRGRKKRAKFKVPKEKKTNLPKQGKKGVDRTGAIKITIDGITFKSKLEGYFYEKTKAAGLTTEYEKLTAETMEGFHFQGKKIQNIEYTIDFIGEDFMVEIKGKRSNEAFPVRFKLFKKHLHDSDFIVRNTQNDEMVNLQGKTVYLLKNQKEINKWLALQKQKRKK